MFIQILNLLYWPIFSKPACSQLASVTQIPLWLPHQLQKARANTHFQSELFHYSVAANFLLCEKWIHKASSVVYHKMHIRYYAEDIYYGQRDWSVCLAEIAAL